MVCFDNGIRDNNVNYNNTSLIRNKRGSIAVFLSLILAALISLALVLVYAAREQAIYSCADGVFNLAGDSLLSEYDYYVYEDYDIFLLSATDKELSRKFKSYAGYTLFPISELELSKAAINAGRFSTASLIPIKSQILDYMTSLGSLKGATGDELENISGDFPKRTLRHEPTIVSLPSRSMPDKSIVVTAEKLAENLEKPELIFRSGTSKFMLDSYILKKFNRESFAADGEHFFGNEVEYIICGELSDSKNKSQTDTALKALRFGLNMQHLYTDPSKLTAIQAASQTLTPGALGTLTQLGIASVWASAEAINDIKLLNAGYRVPIIKDSSSWAVDLDSLINGYDAEKGFIKPDVNRGREYGDYLRILLFIKDENIKIARILDLIQVNMRKNHDSDFLIQECATGISIDCELNGKKFMYDKVY